MNDDPPLEPEPLPPPPASATGVSPLQTEPTAGNEIHRVGRPRLSWHRVVHHRHFDLRHDFRRESNRRVDAVILAIAGMVVLRKRSGPSTILGAVAVGAAVALVLTGACAIVIMNF